MNTIFITGGAGFIGGAVIRFILKNTVYTLSILTSLHMLEILNRFQKI